MRLVIQHGFFPSTVTQPANPRHAVYGEHSREYADVSLEADWLVSLYVLDSLCRVLCKIWKTPLASG